MHDGDALHRGCEYNRGTGCGKTARPGLHGGCRVTGIPTVEASVLKSRANARARLILTITSSGSMLSLRKRAPHPEVELHPAAAQARGIANGDWVSIETSEGRVRARARLNDRLDPRVAVGVHGWWQACAEIGAPGYDPFGPMGANFNLLINTAALDPVSGTASHRAYLCEIRPVT